MDARREVGVVPTETLLAQDGLSFLRDMIDGKFPPPPITQTLGFTLASVDQGRAVFEGEPQFRHYNPIGVVHGGFAMTLLDSALGCAVHTTLTKGEAYTTLEVKVNLVRPLTKDTGLVTAEGRILSSRPHAGTSEGDIKDKRQALRARHDDVHDLPGEGLAKRFRRQRVRRKKLFVGGRCRRCGGDTRTRHGIGEFRTAAPALEVAIGEAEPGTDAAEALGAGLLQVEAGLERQALDRGADRLALDPQGVGRQHRVAGRPRAAELDVPATEPSL